MSIVDYGRTLELQGGKCAICNREAGKRKTMAIDHDHSTGKVRGILCSSCNFALGFCKDDLNTLRNMIEYLEMEGSGKEIIYRKKFVRQPSKADLLKNDMRTELLFGPKTIKELASSLQVAGLVIDKTIRENSDKFSLLNGRVHLSRSISTDSSLRPLRPEKGGNLFATGLRPGATDKDQCLYNQQFTAVASESCLKSQ